MNSRETQWTGPATVHRTFFATCATYELGKRLGVEQAALAFAEQCQQPSRESLPAARLIARLRQLGDVNLCHIAGSCLPKMRSRAAWLALQSGAQFWLMVDDDCECDSATLERLVLEAGDPGKARIVVLPFRFRGTASEQTKVNVHCSPLVVKGHAGYVRNVERAGCGCVLVTRRALELLYEDAANTSDFWIDDDDIPKAPLFAMRHFVGGEWLSEDVSFFHRAVLANIPCVAPTVGHTVHDGATLNLEHL